MQLEIDKHILYRGPFGPPSIPGTYNSTTHKFFRKGSNWGEANITGVAGVSNGSASISFTSLAGVTVVSCGTNGTTTPTVVGDSVIFPAGVFWDLTLSNGVYIPDVTSGYNVTVYGTHGSSSGFTKDITTGGSMYFIENGFNRNVGMIPASNSQPGVDIFGNVLEYPGVFNRHNFCDGIIDYSALIEPIFNKNAYVGNPYSLPEVWTANNWSYNGSSPYYWTAAERTMSYLSSRLTPTYKNTIMIKENLNGGTLAGISREEIFSPAISTTDYNTLNFIYNGIAIP